MGWKAGKQRSWRDENLGLLPGSLEKPSPHWKRYLRCQAKAVIWKSFLTLYSQTRHNFAWKGKECSGPTMPIFKYWQAPKTSEQIWLSGAEGRIPALKSFPKEWREKSEERDFTPMRLSQQMKGKGATGRRHCLPHQEGNRASAHTGDRSVSFRKAPAVCVLQTSIR